MKQERAQWWTMQSEQFRQKVLGGLDGCTAYGLVKSTNLLPIAAQAAIERAYAEFYGCQHAIGEDCMICQGCGKCQETLDKSEICDACTDELRAEYGDGGKQ